MTDPGTGANGFPELFRNELRMLFRDRRTIFVSIVLPALLMPFLMGGSSWVMQLRERSLSEDSCLVIMTGNAPDPVMDAVEAAITDPSGRFSVERGSLIEAGTLLDSGTVQAVVSVSMGRRPVPSVDIRFREDFDRSRAAAGLILQRLEVMRDSVRGGMLAVRGASWTPDSAFVELRDTSPPGAAAGARVGRMAMFFAMIFLLSGVSVAALDSIAGERERGSLETLLASGVERSWIASAKLAAACAVGLTVVLVQVSDVLLLSRLGFFDMGSVSGIHLPAGLIPILVLPLVSASLLAGSLVLYISASSASFKEAQLKMFPALLAGIVPALVTLFPGIEAGTAVMILPVAGAAIAVREALAGRTDVAGLVVSSLSMMAAAALLARATARALSREDILSPSQDHEPSPQLLAKRALPWFGVIWAVSVISSFQMEKISSVVTSLLVNEFLIILAPSLFLAIRFHLPARAVLRLKAPGTGPALMAIPCAVAGTILATDLYSLVSRILPAADRAVGDFSDALMPSGMGLPGLLLLFCILPGVVEEFAFRGVLMGSLGLKRGFGQVRALLVTALVFGMFHFLYFRIVPTAFIGVMTGLAVLLSGSLYTGMIWHTFSNAFAFVAAREGLDLASLPVGVHLLALAVVAGGLVFMARSTADQA